MQLYSGKQNSSYRQIIRFTGVLGSVQFVSLFISLLRNKLAAVILGTIGLGLIDLYNRTENRLKNLNDYATVLPVSLFPVFRW